MGKASEILEGRKKYGSNYSTIYNDNQQRSAEDILNSRMQSKYRNQLNSIDINSLYNMNNFGISSKDKEAYKKRVSQYKTALDNLKKYDSSLSDDDYNNAIASLDNLSSRFDVYESFKSEDDYNRFRIGWGDYYDSNSDNDEKVRARGDYYTNNVAKIADLNERIKNATGSDRKNLTKQKETIETENRNYERNQKVIDDYYKITNNSDFDRVSSNRNYKNPTQEDAIKYETRMNNGFTTDENGVSKDVFGDVFNDTYYDRFSAPQVADRLGLFLGANEKDINDAYASSSNGTENIWASVIKDGIDGSWNKLKENEISIYYYLLNNDGKEKADKYLDDMKVELNRRATNERTLAINDADVLEKIAMNVASIPANIVGGAVGFTEDVINTVLGKEKNPYSTAHSMSNFASDVRGATASDINDLTGNASIPFTGFTFGDAYQAITSGFDSLVGAGMLGKGFAALMGMNSAVFEARKLYEQGASNNQIAMGALTAGVAESLFEYVSLDKFLSTKSPNTWKELGKQVLAQAGVEASEEMCTEIANTISNAIVMRSQSEWQKLYDEGGFKEAFLGTLSEVINAGIGGLISGGAMVGASGTSNLALYNNEMSNYGKNLYNNGSVNTLVNFAKNNDVGKTGNNLLGKVENIVNNNVDNTNLKGKDFRTIGRFADAIDSNFTENAIKAEIEDRLLKQDIEADSKSIDNIYKYITNNADLKFANKYVKAAAEQMYGTKEARTSFDNSVNNRILNSKMDIVNNLTTRVANDVNTKQMQDAYGDKVLKNGKTIDSRTGESIDIKNIRSIENGEMILNKADGEKVSINDIEFSSLEEAKVFETIASLNCSAEVGNYILNAYKSTSYANKDAFLNNVALAYTYGTTNQVNRLNSLSIPSELRNHLFKEGRDASAKLDAIRVEEARNKTVNGNTSNVTYLNGIDKMKLKGTRKSTSDAIEFIAKSSPLDIYVYESYRKGNKTYIKINGNEMESSANGWFVEGTNKVYIDINAGNDYSGLGLFTLSHEISHYIREWNAKSWRQMADLIVETIDGMAEANPNMPTFESLVIDKKMRYEEFRDNGVKDYAGKLDEELYEMAYEDVICDSLSSMMAESETFKKFSDKLYETDKGLWNKLKKIISDFLDRIEEALSAFNGVKAEGYAGQAIQFSKMHEQIRDLYVSAFIGANENYNSAVDNSVSNELENNISTDEYEEMNTLSDLGLSKYDDVKYSDRDITLDTRTLLSNALASTAQNEIEKKYISQYQDNISKINDEQKKLKELRAEIKELSFAKGKRDVERIRSLQSEATKIDNRINNYDKQLLKLESAKPLKDVIQREKAKAIKIEQRKGREALNAYKERAAESRRELMNQYKERNNKAKDRRDSTVIRNKIKKLIDQLNSRELNPKVNSYIPEELMKPVNDILSAINVDSGRSEKLSEKLAELKVKYDAIAKDSNYSVVYDSFISDMVQGLIEKVGDTSIYSMTREQLEATYTTLKALMHTIKTAIKVRNIETEKNAFEISMAMKKETESVSDESSGIASRWLLTSLRPETAFERFAGFKKDSMWGKVYRMLNRGQTKKMQIEMESNKIFNDVFQDESYVKSLSDTKNLVDIGLKDDDGNPVEITKGMALAIYKALMNEDNTRHIMIGGITVPDIKKYYKGSDDAYGVGHIVCHGIGSKGLSDNSNDISDAKKRLRDAKNEGNEFEAIRIDEEISQLYNEREKIIASGEAFMNELRGNISKLITEQDVRLLNATKELFDVYLRGEINKTTMEMYGFEKAQIDNYLSIHTDPNFRQASFEQITKDMNLENSGFMKDRVKASNPIMLEDLAEIVNSQISKVSTYCGFTTVVKDFGKIYGKSESGFASSLQDTIAKKFGTPGKKYIENLLSDIVGSRRGETTFLDRARGHMAGATLSINPRVALSQAASLPTAASELGWDAIRKASGKFFTSHDLELISKHTPLLYNRSKGANIELSDIKSMSQQQNRVMRKLNWLMGWIEAIDKRTVGTLWYASQYYVNENYSDLKEGTDEYYTKVAEVFGNVVERTQPNYTVMQRPDILRNPNALVKQLTMFMTQRLQNFNIVYESAARFKKYADDAKKGINSVTSNDVNEARTDLVRSVSSQLVASASIVGIKFIVDALMHSMNGYRDDDKELTGTSISLAMLDNLLDTLIGNLLGGSEMYSLLNSMITKSRYYGITLNGVGAYTDAIEDFVNVVQNPSVKKCNELAKSVCVFLGIPLANVEKIGIGIYNHIQDIAKGEFLSYEAGVERTSTQDVNRSYEAFLKGDMEKFNSISLKQTVVTKVLKKQFLEAYQKNDTVTMSNIRKYIKATKLYKKDAVKVTQDWIKESNK